MHVKLLVTELLPHDAQKSLRKLISPFLGVIPNVQTKFGLFHTAIIIGPWIVEWNDNNLCVPKRIAATTALLTADIDSISSIKMLRTELVDKLAQLIVEWNSEKTYCLYRITGKNANEGNCQDFVDAVLNKLGISFQPQGALKHCIEDMKSKGVSTLQYKPSAEVKEKLQLEKDSYLFESHQELDFFVQGLIDVCPLFKLDYKHDYSLLKAFDRAFWVRYYKEPDHVGYLPAKNNEEQCSCPFGDPTVT